MSAPPSSLREDAPSHAEPTRSVDETPALAALIRRAGWIGMDKPPEGFVSFASLFLALLSSDDDASQWVQRKAAWVGPKLSNVVARWARANPSLAGLSVERVREARTLALPALPQDPRSSESAQSVRQQARAIALRVSPGGPVDVRHLVAAYALGAHPGHAAELVEWPLRQEAWATRLTLAMAARFPSEARAWIDLLQERFPRRESDGLRAARIWASWIAQLRSPQATQIDAELFAAGVALDGRGAALGDVAGAWFAAIGGEPTLDRVLGVDVASIDRATSAAPSASSDRSTPLPSGLSEPLPFADDAEVLLLRARLFAIAGTVDEGPLHARHLLAALFAGPNDLSARRLCERAARGQAELFDALAGWLGQRGAAGDFDAWKRVQRELREESSSAYETVLAGYSNDAPSGDDRLGIGADVRALAAVLASTKVAPPLAVGLFGEWGTGKSFFMHKLRERIAALAAESAKKRDTNDPSWFCGKRADVIQIEFNAWQYADGDLWASLAAHVFARLGEELQARAASDRAKDHDARLSQLEAQLAALAAQKSELRARTDALAAKLEAQATERAHKTLRLADLAAAAPKEFRRLALAEPKIRAALEDLERLEGGSPERLRIERERLGSFEERANRWVSLLGSWDHALIAVASFAFLAIVAAVAQTYEHTPWLGLLGIPIPIGVLAQRAWAFGGRLGSALDAAATTVEKVEADARARKTPEEERDEAERQATEQRIATVDATLTTLAQAKQALEHESDSARDARSYHDFVTERAKSTDYTSRLGVVAKVHEDFKALAEFLKPTTPPPNVERIVLYVDDLDRCPPKRVVEVLQAIHLILSLPLFVVVVAVDARWLIDSLAAYYRKQFKDAGNIPDPRRPHQYLEKIIQIPYALHPMTEAGYASLVGSLLAPHVDANAAPTAPSANGAAAVVAPQVTSAAQQSPESVAPLSIDATTNAAARTDAPVDLTPPQLRLEPRELEYLKSLSRFVSSPRSAKRLVNLYRIVRARLEGAELDRMIDGGHRITLLCLALVVTNSSFAGDLFGEIVGGRVASAKSLEAWLRSPDNRHADSPIVATIVKLSDHFTDWDEVRWAIAQVSRFSFDTGRLLGAPRTHAHATA